MSSKKFLNTFTKNTLVIQIIFIVAIVTGVIIYERFSNEDSLKIMGENEAALFIDFDNMKRAFAGEVISGMTVLDALNASVAAGKIKLTYHVDKNNNTKVTEINDHKATSDTKFTFYINSKKLDQNKLNKTSIQPGDKITIKLE